ncbi:uncharacterized protein LOC124496322 [Dermatophagoides farinae]|uniref:Uncharacterized protein n=1 Tax=Dermatophagoides farinae TaxID=6954 RepID=A0A9D4SG82_DERFA|nr:uncharacterized protein LOC124496322 [Dermatophagoides farinae]KAH7640581.1 hypothetical protein HUG17_8050 [Dermatophagoides farinae]
MNSHRKQFKGLIERKKYYIQEFFQKLAESDPENLYFNKKELIEIHGFLRKEAMISPWLYKLIETIVDDGIFLDDSTLEINNKDSNDVECTENQIAQLQQSLDEQMEYKRLAEFNRNRLQVKKCPEINDKIVLENNFDIMESCQKLKQSLNETYENGVGSQFDNNKLDNFIKESLMRLKDVIDQYNQSIFKITERFKNDMQNEIDSVLLKYLKMKSMNECDNDLTDLTDFVESNLMPIKNRYSKLIEQLMDLKNLLEKYQEKLNQYYDHCQLRDELKLLKNPIEQQLDDIRNNFMSMNEINNHSYDNDTYEEIFSAIQNLKPESIYDKILLLIRKFDAEKMLLEHELELQSA